MASPDVKILGPASPAPKSVDLGITPKTRPLRASIWPDLPRESQKPDLFQNNPGPKICRQIPTWARQDYIRITELLRRTTMEQHVKTLRDLGFKSRKKNRSKKNNGKKQPIKPPTSTTLDGLLNRF